MATNNPHLSKEQLKRNRDIMERVLIDAIRDKRVKIDYKKSTLAQNGTVVLNVSGIYDGAVVTCPYSYYEELKKRANEQ